MLYIIIFTTLLECVVFTGEYGQFLRWRPVNDDTEERFEYRMMRGHSSHTGKKCIEKNTE